MLVVRPLESNETDVKASAYGIGVRGDGSKTIEGIGIRAFQGLAPPMQRLTTSDKIEGIILAAGLSTRMGAPKLTIEIQGIPIIRRVVRAALESELHHVILVAGPTDSRLTEALSSMEKDPRLLQVVNPLPQAGMSSSMRKGMESLSSETAGVMILLGDQPGITENIINKFLASFLKERTKIIVPLVLGRRTTPVIFPASLFSELMEETGDIGGRNVLKRHADLVVELEMGQEYDDADLDTPEDLDKIRR
jgi:molybdenum cofactor cytidylyltransferase